MLLESSQAERSDQGAEAQGAGDETSLHDRDLLELRKGRFGGAR
jgi:hypothetical protein